jgi:hypothetical protein
LVTVSGSYLKPTASGGCIESPYGYDIMFTTLTGSQMAHEVNGYTPDPGSFTAWVNLPELKHDEDTEFYMYYGNSSITSPTEDVAGVWPSIYRGVWHLEESATSTGTLDLYEDSSIHNNHGDDFVSATGKYGMIYKGQEFDGVDDHIHIDSNAGLEISDLLTMSAWVNLKADVGNNNWQNIVVKGPNMDEGYALFLYGESDDKTVLAADFGFSTGDVDYFDVCDIPIPLNEWVYLVVTFDGSDFRFYVNGVLDATVNNPGTITASTSSLTIGDTDAVGGDFFNGYLEDIRILNAVLPVGEVLTNNSNQEYGSGEENVETGVEYGYAGGDYLPEFDVKNKFIGIRYGNKWMGVSYLDVDKINGVQW